MGLIRTTLVFVFLTLSVSCTYGADFNLVDTHGMSHNLQKYKGKWLLVNFWATWCSVCIDEISELNKLQNIAQDKLSILGVAVYSKRELFNQINRQKDIKFPSVFGNHSDITDFGAIESIPTMFLYNPEGVLMLRKVGFTDYKSLENFINKYSK